MASWKLIPTSLILAIVVTVVFSQFDRGERIRVACIGDSITSGYLMAERERFSYPGRLAQLLGPDWHVGNFGLNGATVIQRGEYAYLESPFLESALAFRPHVALVQFGHNDAKEEHWQYRHEFEDRYDQLIRRLRRLPGRPQVWICIPPPMAGSKYGIDKSVLSKEVVPAILQVATRNGLPVLDLYGPLLNRPECFADGVHPNRPGARAIARVAYKALTTGMCRKPVGGKRELPGSCICLPCSPRPAPGR